MFSSDRFQEAYYEGQRDFITYCAIIVIVFSIIYYLSVCIAEIAAGSGFMAFVQQHVCCCLCPDKEKIRRKNMAKRRARGELVDENPDEDYPDEQPHPSTIEHDENWDEDICSVRPIGLVVESVLWHGLKIDAELRIWQKE